MTLKGTDPGKWNWQLSEKQEGFFPMDADEVKGDHVLTEEDFDALEKQLLKIEDDLRKEGKAPDSVRKVLGGFQQRPSLKRKVNEQGGAAKRAH